MLPTHSTNRIYIAGPMTGIPDFNFPAFNAAVEKLRSDGWDVVNPADHGVIEGAVWADYLRLDIPRLARCGAIYLLPGWENSRGARLEVHIAAHLGLEFETAPGALDPAHHIAAAVTELRKRVCVPEGYVVVPVECTARMENAYDDKCAEDKEYDASLYRPAYAAMLAAAPAPVERNQCDGCQAGIPVESGMHRMGKPGWYADLMACTADRYTTPQPAPTAAQDVEALVDALKALLARDQRNTCLHESTHRGGAIWEICDECGAKWSDDRDPKPEWVDPPEWTRAEELIAAHQSGGAK